MGPRRSGARSDRHSHGSTPQRRKRQIAAPPPTDWSSLWAGTARSCRCLRSSAGSSWSALAPQPLPDLDHAQQVLEDFTVFWEKETEPAAKRQFLSLIFQGVWLEDNRVVAVQPKPPFLPFFNDRRPKSGACAGVKYGSDGGRTLDCCLTGCRLAGRPADRDSLVALRVAYSRRRAGAGKPRRRAAWRRAFQAITARLPQKRNTRSSTSLTHPPTATPATTATTAANAQKPDSPRSRRSAHPSFSGRGHAPNGTGPGRSVAEAPRELGRRLDRWLGPDQVGKVTIAGHEHIDLCGAREREQVVVVGIACH